MKKGIKFLALAIVMFSFASATFAQVSDVATATAVIQAPLTITNTTDLSFGTMASTAGDLVTVTPSGAISVAGTGVTLLGGTVTAAAFNVSGIIGETYAIEVPTTDIVLSDGAGHTMTITAASIVTSPTPTGLLDAAGAQTITLGATLTVGAAQVAGTYTNTTDLEVSINYN